MKISSFDPLFEYPTPVGQQQSGTTAKATAKSVSAPGTKPSNAPSQSPTSTNNTSAKKGTITKAKELKKDFEFPDEKGNVLKVVSPAGEKTVMPNDNEDVVIAQDARKNTFVFEPNADIMLPQVDGEEIEENLENIIDKRKNFAKKI